MLNHRKFVQEDGVSDAYCEAILSHVMKDETFPYDHEEGITLVRNQINGSFRAAYLEWLEDNDYEYGKCVICQKDGSACSACLVVSYCCKEHQKEDWINHQKFCHPSLKVFNQLWQKVYQRGMP